MQILIAEDDSDLLGEVALFLRSQGHVVHEARDGLDALRAMQHVHVDCVLTDLEMPKLDGMGLLGRIRTLWPEIPVALMSGKPSFGKAQWQSAGAVDFLAKPFDFRSLVTLVGTFQEHIHLRNSEANQLAIS